MMMTKLKVTAAAAVLGLATFAWPAGPASGAELPKAGNGDEGQVTYQGRVLGPDGKPVEGASLRLQMSGSRGGQPPVRGRSGTDGRFRFEVPKSEFGVPAGVKAPWRHAEVVASADGFGPGWSSPGGGPEREGDVGGGELTIRLVGRGEPVAGQVLDLQGRPVAGATVRLDRLSTTESDDLAPYLKAREIGRPDAELLLAKYLFDPSAAGLPTILNADASGRFRIEGAGRGRVLTMRIGGPGIEETTVRAADQALLATPEVGPERAMANAVTSSGGGRTLHGPTFVILAGPGRTLDGLVRDAGTGKPIAGVHVSGSGEGHAQLLEAITDVEGKYRLHGLPISSKIQVNFFPGKGEAYLPGTQIIEGRDAAPAISAEIGLTRGIVARGRVVDKVTGKPVVGSIVYRPLAGNAAFRDTPAGEFVKRVSASDSVLEDGSFEVVVGPGLGLIAIQVQAGPPGGRERATRYLPAHRTPDDGAASYGDNPDLLVGVSGQPIPVSLYQGYALVNPGPGDRSVTCELKLVPGDSLAGRVVDPDGRPLGGTTVEGLEGPLGGSKTLIDPEFTVTSIEPGRPRHLFALHKGRKLAGSLIVTGTEAGPIELKLAAWGSLSARMVDGDGEPVAGAEVYVTYQEKKGTGLRYSGARSGEERIVTDREGQFRVEGLIPGRRAPVFLIKDGEQLSGGGLEDLEVRPGESKELGTITARPFGG